MNEVYIDDQNHLWLSNTFAPVVDHAWVEPNIFHYPFLDLEAPLPVVNAIIETQNRQIWCSTILQGIYVFDLNGRLIQRFSYYTANSAEKNLPEPIRQLSLDQDSMIWALSDQYLYAFADNRWRIAYASKKNKLYDLIHVDRQTKVIATNDGVLELTLNKLNKQFTVKDTLEETRSFKGFYDAKQDSGFLYFSFRERELRLFQRKNGQFQLKKKLDLGERVYSILEQANEQKVILGTTRGLQILRLDSLALKHFPYKNPELNKAQINSIIKDDKELFWLATNKGLYNWNPRRQEFYQYGLEDGLLTNQFTEYASLQASNGKIWLNSNKGLVFFHPDSIRPYPFGPQIQIKSLLINDKPYFGKRYIGETETFKLAHTENSLDFTIAALTSYSPQRNTIFYCLKEYNKTWKSIENGGIASFHNLPPGNYALEIYGLNANGVKGEIKSISVIIGAPFWHSFSFWAGVIAIISFLIYLGVKTSNRIYAERKLAEQRKVFEEQRKALEQKQALQKALQDQRNRIADDMHDDLGGGLTSIRLLLTRAEEKKRFFDNFCQIV